MLLLRSVPFFLLTAAARAGLAWADPIASFQCLPDQTSVEAHFAFKNTGRTAVTIRQLVTSCGCTTAKLEKKTYAPGESGEVVATYSFRFQSGLLRKTVNVTTDDGAEPVVLDIRVTRQEPFEVKPALVFWRQGEAGQPKAVQLVADHFPVHVKSVTSSNPRLSATLQTVKEGQEYTVVVKPADTAQREAAEIQVTSDYPASQPRVYTIHARVK